MIHGFLFADSRYAIGHKIVCFPGCFDFVVVVVVTVAVFAVATVASAVVAVAVIAADVDGE